MALTDLDMQLLKSIADMHKIPVGAYNIRKDGQKAARNTTAHIDIESRKDCDGINIYIADGTKNESVHIPVIIEKTGYSEVVTNEFFVGKDCDVLIIAGCGISNCGAQKSQHDGVHIFHIGENSRVRYVEKHYGQGEGTGERIMNPGTKVYLEEGASFNMEATQIRGITSTNRLTEIHVDKGAETVITERLLTHDRQKAESRMNVYLEGEDSTARIISRSVAQNRSEQVFYPCVTGENKCFGHVQCDAIIMDEAKVASIPAIRANCVDAQLIHEAAIGRIAGDQLIKLMTFGLTREEAEEKILEGFLR